MHVDREARGRWRETLARAEPQLAMPTRPRITPRIDRPKFASK
jgi:hypothetical protein